MFKEFSLTPLNAKNPLINLVRPPRYVREPPGSLISEAVLPGNAAFSKRSTQNK